MGEIGSKEYWERRINRWKSNKDLIIKSLGKKYYEDHLKRWEDELKNC